mmetsp:Transcript_31239/g.91503  ORF Transcript_31239/g.91503 Transcript_31239/m.91503 type:complete len:291 (+) Transcript_31239:360-1232(+)
MDKPFKYTCRLFLTTLLDIFCFTCRPNPSARTGAREAVDSISTRAAVEARIILAFIDIDLAIGSIIPKWTLARVRVVPIHTSCSVQARTITTVIDTGLTQRSSPTRSTTARVRTDSIDTTRPVETSIINAVVNNALAELSSVAFRADAYLRVVWEVCRLSIFTCSTIEARVRGAILLLCHDGGELGGISVMVFGYDGDELRRNGIIGPFRATVLVDDVLSLVHNDLKMRRIHCVFTIAWSLSISLGVGVIVHYGRPNAGPSFRAYDTEAIFILHCRRNLRHFGWSIVRVN